MDESEGPRGDAIGEIAIYRGSGAAADFEPCRAGDTALRDSLARVVRSEVLPRIMLERRLSAKPQTGLSGVDETDVDTFARALLTPTDDLAWGHIFEARRRGLGLGAIFLDLVAPAARRLGALWESDACDFIDVTAGLHRLKLMMRSLAPPPEERVADDGAPRLLLSAAPEETHAFGLDMVENFFASAGWSVFRAAPEALDAELGARWYDIVGFSIGCARYVDPLRNAVAGARRASANAAITVMVGGRHAVVDPNLAARIGADSAAIDAPSAVHVARSLLHRRARV